MNIMQMLGDLRKKEVETVEAKPSKRPRNILSMDEVRKHIIELVELKEPITGDNLAEISGLGVSTSWKKLKVLADKRELKRVYSSGKGSGHHKLCYVINEKTPKVEPAVGGKENRYEDILQYASDHDGQRYSLLQMAADLDIPSGTIYPLVYDLQKRGNLFKDFNIGEKPYIKKGEVRDVTEYTDASVDYTKGKEYTTNDTIDNLAWVFVKETGSVNILEFLKWIEKPGE